MRSSFALRSGIWPPVGNYHSQWNMSIHQGVQYIHYLIRTYLLTHSYDRKKGPRYNHLYCVCLNLLSCIVNSVVRPGKNHVSQCCLNPYAFVWWPGPSIFFRSLLSDIIATYTLCAQTYKEAWCGGKRASVPSMWETERAGSQAQDQLQSQWEHTPERQNQRERTHLEISYGK